MDYRTRGVCAQVIHFELDGDIVNTGGSMSGGSKKLKTDNLLSQKRNLSALETEIEELEKTISKSDLPDTDLIYLEI